MLVSLQSVPAVRQLREALKTDDPVDYATRVMGVKDLSAHLKIWTAADAIKGPKEANRLFWWVALEALAAHPRAGLLFWDGIVDFLLAGDVVYNSGARVAWNGKNIGTPMAYTYIPDTSDVVPASGIRELQAWADHATTDATFWEILFYWQTGIKIAAVLVCICFGGTLLRSDKPLYITAALLLSLVLYQDAVCSLFAAPHFRYIVPMIPAILMLATCCVASYHSRTTETASEARPAP
jgi:hypothetical protein